MIKENETVEFKSNFNDGVIESLAAFANTKGGKVYIGLDDKGKPVSNFSVGKETIAVWINEIKNKTQPGIIPDIEEHILDHKPVISLHIDEFPVKPVAFKGRFYKRVANSNHQLSIQEITDLHLKTYNTSWDFYPSPHYSLHDIALEKVNQFIAVSNKLRENQIQDEPLAVLRKFELLKEDGQIANAAFLLFAKNDVFDATIAIGRFSSETSIKDSFILRTDLFSEVSIALEYIKKHLNKNYIITGNPQREEKWEYPLDALREIVINMIVHRDYQNAGESNIKIFDNKIEFYNPGSLGNDLTVEKLKSGSYTSYARNKKIAELFREAGVIEKYGSGIKRINDSFLSYGLPVPVFENFQKGFKVTICNLSAVDLIDTTEKGVEKGVEKITENQRKILSCIEKDPYISAQKIAQTISLSPRKVQENCKKLKAFGFIERVGAAKGGYWKIIVKQERSNR